MQNHSTPETHGGTTRDEPDYRLRVFIWDTISHHDPKIEYFSPIEWDKAIDRAREISRSPDPLSRIQVVDAWGMLIAQFCPQLLFMGEDQFEKYHG